MACCAIQVANMRYQGKITSWKDDQGFGFVTKNGTEERAFVHIKAFSDRGRRPVEGDIITYELGVDEKRRLRADTVRFSVERTAPKRSATLFLLSIFFACLFCCFLVATTLMGRLPFAVLGVYIVASVIAYVAYAIDKSAAQNNRSRTPERTLHWLGFIGGWPGALVAQTLLRHKSSKQEFQNVFWSTVVFNSCALGWLFTKSGSAFIQSIAGFSG